MLSNSWDNISVPNILYHSEIYKNLNSVTHLGITSNIVDLRVCENTLVTERNTPVLKPIVPPI